MAGFGRPPKPEGQRRGRNPLLAGHVTRLSRSGRAERVPTWPLSRGSKAERDLWVRLWAIPQSAAWESLGWVDVVARYTRLAVLANEHGAQVALLSEVRQLEDRLGLTPMAMLRLRWEIVEDTDSENQEPSGVLDIRQRLARGS